MPLTYNVTGEKGQTIFEIALQEHGSINAIDTLLTDNRFLNNFSGQQLAGKSVVCRSNNKLVKEVVNFFKVNYKPGNMYSYYWIPGGLSSPFDDPEIDDMPINWYV